jgi:hypothetical protein
VKQRRLPRQPQPGRAPALVQFVRPGHGGPRLEVPDSARHAAAWPGRPCPTRRRSRARDRDAKADCRLPSRASTPSAGLYHCQSRGWPPMLTGPPSTGRAVRRPSHGTIPGRPDGAWTTPRRWSACAPESQPSTRVRSLMDDWMAGARDPGKTSPGLQDTCWRAGRRGMRKSCVTYVGASFDGVPTSTDATAILPSASGRRRVTTQCADLRYCPLRAVKQWEKWCRRSIPSLVCIGCLARLP